MKFAAWFLIVLGLFSLLGILFGNQPDLSGVTTVAEGDGRRFGFFIAPAVILLLGFWILGKSKKKKGVL